MENKYCRNCEHSILDEKWGEYKCKKWCRICTDYERLYGCPKHKLKEKK